MNEFFRKWREWAERIWRAMILACALLCFFGALEVRRLEAPSWLSYVCVGFGLVLLVRLVWPGGPKAKRSEPGGSER